MKYHCMFPLIWAGCQKSSVKFVSRLTTKQSATFSLSQTVTVKDLLLSNLGHKISRQDLVLSEDEKKLLAKEGVSLLSKLPLTKFEEKVLKKIRRKIHNKYSAQESRKKKKESIDSLEGRMFYRAHNLRLQRKIQELEQTNSALMEQLRQLQAFLPKSSSKTAQRRTCILVLLLFFSFLMSSHLQPHQHNPLNGEYTETKVPSRSLKSTEEEEGILPSRPPSQNSCTLCSAQWKKCGPGQILSLLTSHHPTTMITAIGMAFDFQEEPHEDKYSKYRQHPSELFGCMSVRFSLWFYGVTLICSS
ncbi:cyclic AMP-responsive element-binding protein 3-like protein 3-B [Thalassophryne amazonica]|uniref:cyclic AMP-responsive element-binding protein 3-like protein 3-B n=1 Tax=Thalassophryne amazonica TaxID=390379 RepID=UPI0014717767|nr:cyclic AMP-responsive element-binding protein 3-like protein 3-B [Thalassophryne amazonica]